MVKSANLNSVEDRLHAALEEYCISAGAKPGEFAVSVFRHYMLGYLTAEIITDHFNHMEASERHRAAKEFLRQHLSAEDFKEVTTVHITTRNTYSTVEQRNEEGKRRMEYSRV